MSDKPDPGKHYRFSYKGIKLDPFRLARIYKITNPAQFTILKKAIRLGTGGKDKVQDLKDIISAAERELELMREDLEPLNLLVSTESLLTTRGTTLNGAYIIGNTNE